MSSNDEFDLAPYLKVDQIVTRPVSTLTVLFFLYGIHVVISGLAIHVLLVRRDGRGASASKLYLPCTIALLVLITVYAGLNAWEYSREASIQFGAASTKDYGPFRTFLFGDFGKIAWSTTVSMISNFMNVIADTMLIHRCYVIWNSNKLVLCPLVFIAFVLNGIDLACIVADAVGLSNPSGGIITAKAFSIDHATLVAIAFFQLVLAFMTGGRIWWITRRAQKLTGQSANTTYTTIVSIILESGFLYAATLIGYAIYEFLSQGATNGLVPFDPTIAVVPMSGLAPTLVIVRVAYHKSVDSVQQMMTTLQFAEGREDEQQSESTAAGQTPVDIRGGIRVRVDHDSSPSSRKRSQWKFDTTIHVVFEVPGFVLQILVYALQPHDRLYGLCFFHTRSHSHPRNRMALGGSARLPIFACRVI
ncbi:hypothetical protein PM082_008968 [Marasmius tenuissimus]|nr:hypothetical protein PM082_008968 [Marasmius tenuissimus]